MTPEVRALYLEDFLTEAFENLDLVATKLSSVTADELDQAAIDHLFRCVHNVKGMSGTIGVLDITEASHGAEEILAGCRERRAMTADEHTQLLAMTDGIADLLDALRADPDSIEPDSAVADEPNRVPVDVDKLDSLLDITTELVVARGLLEQQVDSGSRRDLQQSATHIRKLTTELQWLVTELRMVSTKSLLTRVARLARETARERSKDVEVNVLGLETTLDRSLVNELADPLAHLVRNAIDHGIEDASTRLQHSKHEPAAIWIEARRRAGRFVVSVRDNGGGIDTDAVVRKALGAHAIEESVVSLLSEQERLELIFKAGVSTAGAVDHVSGRGVGLDAVAHTVAGIGGRIAVVSEAGAGTTISISLPLSLAIADVLLTRIGVSTWGVPLDVIVETLIVDPSRVVSAGERSMIEMREGLSLIVDARRFLTDGDTNVTITQPRAALILSHSQGTLVLLVDELLTTEEVVVKPSPSNVGRSPAVGATTILRDGSVGLLLDVEGLMSTLVTPTSLDVAAAGQATATA